MTEEFESKLIPIMREGVDVIKMIVFKRLREYFMKKYPEKAQVSGKLAGAVLNDLFCTPNHEESFVAFAKENQHCIEEAEKNFSVDFEELCIPVTDGVRVQFLCDSMEGIDTSAMLVKVQELGILLEDREVPLPKHFLELVRRLGRSFNILADQNTQNAEGKKPH